MTFAGILIIYDIAWFIVTGENWTKIYAGADIWNSLHGLRVFVFSLSIISTLLKVKDIIYNEPV